MCRKSRIVMKKNNVKIKVPATIFFFLLNKILP